MQCPPRTLALMMMASMAWAVQSCTPAPDPDPDAGPEDLCGNGAIDDGEDCDGDELGEADCVSQDFDYGTLACKDDCTFDTEQCVDDPCYNYPCGPYGKDLTDVVEDLVFMPGNQAAKDFTATDDLALHDYYQRSVAKGGDLKALVIFVSTGWCGYCAEEASQLDALSRELAPEGIAFLGLVTEDNRGAPATASFAKTYGDNYSWSFPAVAGDLSANYWYPNDAGAVPMHLFIDLRTMRYYARSAGLADNKMLSLALRELADAPAWDNDFQRTVDFDCNDGFGSETEPNGFDGTLEVAATLPFDLSGTICPPSVFESIMVDFDVVNIGAFSKGDVVQVAMSPGVDSDLLPYFMIVRLNGDNPEWSQPGPGMMSSGTVSRTWLIDTDGTYAVAATDASYISSSYYYGSTMPASAGCCNGGPSYTYELATSSQPIEAGPTALATPALNETTTANLTMSDSQMVVVPVDVINNQRYQFDMVSPNLNVLDPYLILYDPTDGSVIGKNDDVDANNEDYNSQIVWRPHATKTVWLVASYYMAFFRSGEPSFTMKAKRVD